MADVLSPCNCIRRFQTLILLMGSGEGAQYFKFMLNRKLIYKQME